MYLEMPATLSQTNAENDKPKYAVTVCTLRSLVSRAFSGRGSEANLPESAALASYVQNLWC